MTVIIYPRVSEEDQIPKELGRDHQENTARLLDTTKIQADLDFLARTIRRIRKGQVRVNYRGFPESLVHETLAFILNHLQKTFADIKPIIAGIKIALDAKEELGRLLVEFTQGSIEVIGEVGHSEGMINLGRWATALFTQTTKRLVGIADSHTIVFPAYGAVKTVNPKARIASFVFDRHIDLTGTGALTLKSRIYAPMLGNNTIDFLIFAGMPETEGRIDDEVYEKYQRQGKVTAIPDEEYEINGRVDEVRFAIALKNQFSALKAKGITAVTITVDLDVLRSDLGYTAFDFSPAHLFTVLLRIDVQEMSPQEIIDTFVFGKSKKVGELFSVAYMMAGKGLSLSCLEQGIDVVRNACSLAGISFGISLPCGGYYLGEVVELIGPDYQGRTTKAVGSLIERFLK